MLQLIKVLQLAAQCISKLQKTLLFNHLQQDVTKVAFCHVCRHVRGDVMGHCWLSSVPISVTVRHYNAPSRNRMQLSDIVIVCPGMQDCRPVNHTVTYQAFTRVRQHSALVTDFEMLSSQILEVA